MNGYNLIDAVTGTVAGHAGAMYRKWAQEEHRTLPLSPPRGSKTKTPVFCQKSHFD